MLSQLRLSLPSEYVPKTTTTSHPGHAYTDCHGSTSYLGDFRGFEDSNGDISGRVSGTADTDTRCKTTFTPPTETSVTHYDRLNYTIAKGAQALYLLSCTQHWKPTRKERAFGALIGATVGSGQSSDTLAQKSVGAWTECRRSLLAANMPSLLATRRTRISKAPLEVSLSSWTT